MPRELNALIRESKHGNGRRGAGELDAPTHEDWRDCDHCGSVGSVIHPAAWQGTLCCKCGHKTFANEKAKAKHDMQYTKGRRR